MSYDYITFENGCAYANILTYKHPTKKSTIILCPLVHMAEESYFTRLLEISGNKPVLIEIINVQQDSVKKLNGDIIKSPDFQEISAILQRFPLFLNNAEVLHQFYEVHLSSEIKKLMNDTMDLAHQMNNQDLLQLLDICKFTGFDSVCTILLQRFAASILGLSYSMSALSTPMSVYEKDSLGWVTIPLVLSQNAEDLRFSLTPQTINGLNQLANNVVSEVVYFADYLKIPDVIERKKKYVSFLGEIQNLIQNKANEVITTSNDALNYLRDQIQQGINAKIDFVVITGAVNLSAMEDEIIKQGLKKTSQEQIKIVNLE